MKSFLLLLSITPFFVLLCGCQSNLKIQEGGRSLASSEMIPMNPKREQVPEPYKLSVDINRLACHMARSLNPIDAIEPVQKRRERIKSVLLEIDKNMPYLLSDQKERSMLSYITSQLYSQKDLFIQDAFIRGQTSIQGSNFSKAFENYIAREQGRDSNYDAVNDPKLFTKVKAEELKFIGTPSIDDLDYPKETKYLFKYQNEMDKIQSPLTEWIIQKPKHSIGLIELFEKATSIYGDPWVALGVITRLTRQSAMYTPRKKMAVIASRIKSIYAEPTSDHAGTLYHFWGYLTLIVNEPQDVFRMRTSSYGWEMIGQQDHQDFFADYWGMETGLAINRQWTGDGEKPCDEFDNKIYTRDSIPVESRN